MNRCVRESKGPLQMRALSARDKRRYWCIGANFSGQRPVCRERGSYPRGTHIRAEPQVAVVPVYLRSAASVKRSVSVDSSGDSYSGFFGS